MKCQRCQKELPLRWIASSDILHLKVCDLCAREALPLVGDTPDCVSLAPLLPEAT